MKHPLWPASKPRLFIDAQHGLANRLRSIASAHSIAQRAGYELFIIWRPDHHCDCLFSDLFDYAGPVVDDALADLCRTGAAKVFNYMEIENGARFQAPIMIDPGTESFGDVYIRSAYTLNSPLRSHADEQAFLKALVPSAPVMDLIADVMRPSSLSAHVRSGMDRAADRRSYEAADNWPAHRHRELTRWREKSQPRHFTARLDALIEEDADATIFLAADHPETYALFAKRYGPRLRHLPRTLYDRSGRQLQYALADMILLTASRRFLASTFSSYSDLVIRLMGEGSIVERSGIDF